MRRPIALGAPVLLVAQFFLTALASAGVVLSEVDARLSLGNFLASIDRYHGRFEQTIVDESGGVVEEAEGEVWLQRPSRFRWNYTAPWPRLIVANASQVWLYDEELDQVTVRSVDNTLQETPAALLVGDATALDNYNIAAIQEDTGRIAAELIPESGQGDFLKVYIEYRGAQLESLQLVDRFGQTTRISFEAIAMNLEPDDDLFSFVVPEGVDVIDERANPELN